MTTPELYRKLADETELREMAEQRIKELEAELQALRAKVLEQEPQQWFTPAQAALFIGMSIFWLNQDRIKPKPVIPYDKRGHRTIRYHRPDLCHYLETKKPRKAA